MENFVRYTLRIASIFGIPVRVHATFPLVLVVFGAEGFLRGGAPGGLYAMALVLVVFGCVVLHEMGHSLQARRYGVVVHDIVLLPVGGMARADRIPDDPRREVAIALSGPAVNGVIVAVGLVVMHLLGLPLGGDGGFISDVVTVNIALAVFNLIPAFPMDGGRVLRALFASRMPYLDATRHATNVGFVIAQIFAVIGFAFTSFAVLPLIAVVVFAGALGEERMIRARFRQEYPQPSTEFRPTPVPPEDVQGSP
jgi:Zn-dependent protease